MDTEFKNKTVAVVGLARSGLACCHVLTQLGATVIPYDGKPAESLSDALAEVAALGLTPVVGGAPLDYSGLDYVVTSPGVRKDAAVLVNAVAAGVPVLGEIEAAYRIARAPILAITGTNGKTITTMLLGEMLKAAGIQTYIAGNIAAGEIALPLIQAAFDAPADAAIVAEISSFQLEWISTFRPKVAALLNISPDHSDRQTWEEYVAVKWRIFENQTKEDRAVVQDDLRYEFRDFGFAIKAHSWDFDLDTSDEYGVYAFTDGMISIDDNSLDYSTVGWGDLGICKVADVKLPGRHNLLNICAASAMAYVFGVGVKPIGQVATTFTGVVHRAGICGDGCRGALRQQLHVYECGSF